MLGRANQDHPTLTYTKFSPARPDTAIKWAGAQIWFGPPRAESLLVADCIDEEWAKSLALAYNNVTSLTAKMAAANQVVRDLLAAVSGSAKELELADPKAAKSLSALVTSIKTQAKQAGLNTA